MNIGVFIEHIIKFQSTDEILDYYKSQSEKGYIYERLWDVVIKFGFCDHFQRSYFTNLTGNMNNGNLKKLTTFTHYLNMILLNILTKIKIPILIMMKFIYLLNVI